MISRFRAVLPRVLVPRARSVSRLTSLSVSVQHPSGSSAVWHRTNDTAFIQKRTFADMTSISIIEFGKQLVELWITLYPRVKEAVDKWTDADQVCERCDASI